LFVNGKHFAFSVAAYKTITLAECSPISGLCSPGSYVSNCQEAYASRGQTFVPSMYWDNTCLGVQTKTTRMLLCNTAPGSCPQDCISCDANDTGFYLNTTTALTRTVGCAKLYTIVSNHPLIPEWCDDVDRDCLTDNPYIAGYDPSVDPCQWTSADEPGCNLSASERFDLDRNGVPDVTTNREKFAWQWFLVMGVDETKDTQRAQDTADSLNSGSEDSLSSEIPILLRAEGVVLPGGEQEAKNISLDFDCDLKLENIVANTENESPNKVSESGILLEVGVMDMQEGDIDTTYDDSDKARGIDMYGLTKDVNLYSFVKGDGPNGGTYFQIEEGKLFDNDRQFIRTTSKKDQVDLIERVWRLSNNTGGYCTKDIPPEPTSNAHVKEAYGLDVNPVEACAYAGGCHSGSTIHLTCMDVDNNLLFIRSRIEDLHGRKWVTDVTDDPHFDFQ
ncbi:MAG TPA: hypothetical protein PKV41_02910, partial [Candidatus Omnitrophota bacterium]|nr:hypothetical protein [Candidatus Omnitrophota bacterium]